jgi:hypothetical protein
MLKMEHRLLKNHKNTGDTNFLSIVAERLGAVYSTTSRFAAGDDAPVSSRGLRFEVDEPRVAEHTGIVVR